MRKVFSIAGLALLLCLAVPYGFARTPAKSGASTIVIVFKDGHRQSFNLSEVARVEFGGNTVEAETASAGTQLPRQYVGRWEVGDGNGRNFYITLREDGTAVRSQGNVHGKWVFANGEAEATWDDGVHDAIRKAGSGFQKRAFGATKSFTDNPDNVANAQNTTPHPL